MSNLSNYEKIDRNLKYINEAIIEKVTAYRKELVAGGYNGEGLSELDENIESLTDQNAFDEVFKGCRDFQDAIIDSGYDCGYFEDQINTECENWANEIIYRVDSDIGFDITDDCNDSLFDHD